MARSHVNSFSPHPYHITARTVNRENFKLPLDQVWNILCEQLFLAHHINGFRTHLFVLMPNHFHLIGRVTEKPLQEVMAMLMRESSKEINFRSQTINQNWGGRHYKCEIGSYHYFMNTYKYVYQNPVRAKLVDKVEDWPYSTLNGLLGFARLPFPIEDDSLFFFEKAFNNENLIWLNNVISEKDLTSIRSALIKKTFQLNRNTNGFTSDLENRLI